MTSEHGLPLDFKCPFEEDIKQILPLKDHIGKMSTDIAVAREVAERVESKLDIVNGSVQSLQRDALLAEGASKAFRWMTATLMALFTLAIGAAGVVTTIVVRLN